MANCGSIPWLLLRANKNIFKANDDQHVFKIRKKSKVTDHLNSSISPDIGKVKEKENWKREEKNSHTNCLIERFSLWGFKIDGDEGNFTFINYEKQSIGTTAISSNDIGGNRSELGVGKCCHSQRFAQVSIESRVKLIRQNSRLPHDDTLFSHFFARIVSISFRLINIFLFGEADARAGEAEKREVKKSILKKESWRRPSGILRLRKCALVMMMIHRQSVLNN